MISFLMMAPYYQPCSLGAVTLALPAKASQTTPFFASEITTRRRTGRRTMRATGLVLLSIAIMALLLTDADAKRRSSAQGSQAAGASRSWCATHPRHGTENCGYASFDPYCGTIGAECRFCRANPVPGSGS